VAVARLGVDGGDGKDQDSERQPWCDGVSPQIRFGLQKKKTNEGEREACERSRVVGEDKMGAGVVVVGEEDHCLLTPCA
jgi:hypothetical protein